MTSAYETTMSAKEALQELEQQRQWERVKLVAQMATAMVGTRTSSLNSADAREWVNDALTILNAAENALKQIKPTP